MILASSGGALQREWYVLQTKRHKERAVSSELSSSGIRTYLPLMELRPRPAVGSAIAPVFPTYLFVNVSLDREYYRAARTPGVKNFVHFGDGPATVDETTIRFLRHREDAKGVLHCGGPARGDEVRIADGPLAGLRGLVEECLPARQRIRVLLQLFQRTTRIELPESYIRSA